MTQFYGEQFRFLDCMFASYNYIHLIVMVSEKPWMEVVLYRIVQCCMLTCCIVQCHMLLN